MENAQRSNQMEFRSRRKKMNKFDFRVVRGMPNKTQPSTVREETIYHRLQINQQNSHTGRNLSQSIKSGSTQFYYNPPPLKIVMKKCYQAHNQGRQFIDGIGKMQIIQKRKQIEQIKRSLSERKMRIWERFQWLDERVNDLKIIYSNQQQKLTGIVAKINHQKMNTTQC